MFTIFSRIDFPSFIFMWHNMKKLLIPAFACAAMFTACGDDSSSANSDVTESSSSVAAESSSSVTAESSSSDWAHEDVGVFACFSASDPTTGLKYSFEGPDSAMEVVRNIYPKLNEDVEKVCEEAKANKTDDQEVTCDSFIVKISDQPKTITFDSFKALMTEECYNGIAINPINTTNPDVAPENGDIDELKKLFINPFTIPMPVNPNPKSPLCKITPEAVGCPNSPSVQETSN